jgi:hypothetical protein
MQLVVYFRNIKFDNGNLLIYEKKSIRIQTFCLITLFEETSKNNDKIIRFSKNVKINFEESPLPQP